METFYIPSETDFKKWIKDAVKECLAEALPVPAVVTSEQEPFLSRKEIAAKLNNISLVTLTDWVKRGLPSHKHRGRVYFIYSEVMEYIRNDGAQKE